MPKASRRSKATKGSMSLGDQLLQGKRLLGDPDSDFDVDSNAECTSVRSINSSRRDQNDFDDFADDGFADGAFGEDSDTKLLEHLDNATEKNAKTRCEALKFIKNALAGKFLNYFVMDRKATIAEAVERSLKKGKGEEQENAILLAIAMWITMGSIDEMDSFFRDLKPILLTTMNDASMPANVRAQCASALAIGCFVAPNGSESLPIIMDSLYGLFSCSFLKGNGVAPILSPSVTTMHGQALLGWSLLLTVLPSDKVLDLSEKHLTKIAQLLESSDLELRIIAGESIALMYEISRDVNQDFEFLDDLANKLKQLATDCQKSRSKKDRKVQRSNFRDILKSVEDDQAPQLLIKFGRETLRLDTWLKRIQYEAFCNVLSTGMNLHLARNELLRDIFELGAPLPEEFTDRKALRTNWQNENAAIIKARTKHINKQRDRKFDIE